MSREGDGGGGGGGGGGGHVGMKGSHSIGRKDMRDAMRCVLRCGHQPMA
jgi:hypothetical protein